MSKREFIIIIVDTPDQALLLNGILPTRSADNRELCIEAFSVGQSLCGLHYNGKRPSVVIRAHKPLEGVKLLVWEKQCLLTVGNKDTVWIGGEKKKMITVKISADESELLNTRDEWLDVTGLRGVFE